MSQLQASISGARSGNSERYAWYMLGLLIVAYIFSFIDRQILSLLVGPMKRDLGLSDTQVSLLLGPAFGIFYATLGIPIGRLVDRSKRVRIIAVGVFLWSLMTAFCGLARNYFQLFIFRMGVGVGEAALSPGAYSMVADSFKPERQGLALGIYSMGIYIGSGLAFMIGGVIVAWVAGGDNWVLPFFGEIYSWQVVFLIVGLPGIPLAFWVLSLREPERKGVREGEAQVPLGEVATYMLANKRTLFCHHVSYAIVAMVGYGIGAWTIPFFVRTYGMPAGEAAIYYGALVGIFGTMGVIFGGWLGDYLNQRGHRNGKMWVHVVCTISALFLGPISLLMPTAALALILSAPGIFVSSMLPGVAAAGVQELMPNRMRGVASAFLLFVVNILGLGLGPILVALCTDYVFQDESMLRYSMVLVMVSLLSIAIMVSFYGLSAYSKSRDYLEEWLKQDTAKA